MTWLGALRIFQLADAADENYVASASLRHLCKVVFWMCIAGVATQIRGLGLMFRASSDGDLFFFTRVDDLCLHSPMT